MAARDLAGDKKNAAHRRAVVAFVDESGLSLIPLVHKTWAPRGQTPTLTHCFNWTKLSAISAITPSGNLYFRVHRGAIDAERVVAFLRHLLRHVRRRPVVILWDGAPIHRSARTRAFLAEHPRLEVHRLPAYCPELNPDEWFWSHLKRHELANLAPHNVRQLRDAIRLAVVRVRRRKKLVRSFFRACPLTRG